MPRQSLRLGSFALEDKGLPAIGFITEQDRKIADSPEVKKILAEMESKKVNSLLGRDKE